MTSTLRGYRRHIMQACGCDPDDTGLVEELMREQTPTGCLDALDRAAFDGLARDCLTILHEIKATDQDTVAFLRKCVTP